MLAITFLEGSAAGLAGFALGYAVLQWQRRQRRRALELESSRILGDARRQAETLEREARLAATEESAKIREQTEKSFAARRREMAEIESRLAQRESLVAQQLETLLQRDRSLERQHQELQERIAALDADRAESRALLVRTREELQRVGRFTAREAREQLLKQVERETLLDSATLSKHILDKAKSTAEEQARKILSLAIQRYAGGHTSEITTSTLAIQGDDIKGRIIGREGRNIRAFEAATGVTVLIDDTPGAVVLSGFDPVRRQIAREAMHRLIQDGRIHPSRIEEIVAQVSQEMEEVVLRAGEEATHRLGLSAFPLEITKTLGRLRFRQSFSQNILDHSVEVGHLTGLMATELGLDQSTARRVGLLHDIGKALDHELEGSHAAIGAEFVRRHGEADEIVNGVASHHDEVPHTCLWGILVSAADAISASRPGARPETMTTYINRLEHLERVGSSFAGVEKCFAVQAGRELRVIVQPDAVTDEKAFALARSIARRIEEEMQYPGQIRVTVVRETRCVEFAK